MPAGKLKVLLTLATCLAIAPLRANDEKTEGPTPAQSLQMLEEGNVRFQSGAAEGPRRDEERRAETFKGQHPFAAVLSCADSRVAPELLFDTGIGDLFVVRVAGNVADVDEIGTMEYGVEHLHVPLIVVVGHSKCGAVTAVAEGKEVPPNIAKLVDNIIPAVETTKKRFASLKGPALVQQAIRMNVRQAMADLLTHSEIIKEAVSKGEVKVVGAVYDINSGSVEWMGPHPDETALLAQGEATASIDEHGGELVKPDEHAKPSSEAKEEKPEAKEPAGKAHSGEAKPAAHGKTAEDPKKAEHGKSDAHESKDAHSSKDGHGEESAEEGEEHPATQPSAKNTPLPHNFTALGGCLAGGAVMSVLTIHLMKPRKPAKQPVK